MKTKVLLLALLLTAVSAAAQSPALPDTPAAKQFAAWLAAFNSGDAATIRTFWEKNDPERAKQTDQAMRFRQQTGGFDFKKVEESTPTRLSGLVKERNSDQYGRFTVEVEASEPHKVVKLAVNAVPTPTDIVPARLSQADALAALRTEMEKGATEDRFAGAAMVVKDGKPVFSAAYGLADREKKTPAKVSTQFRLGSMNKMFTATAILQLVQAGKFELTDTVGTILTDYPNQDLAKKVTIHHLLTHTGGTGDFFGPEFDTHRLELKTLQDYVKLYGKRGLEFEPGSKWEYSNYGFLLLGVIVEKVSGQNYYDYVAEHIFKPAGMTATASLSEDQVVPDRSVGYTKFDGGSTWKPNIDTLMYRGNSAGGGYSTVEDLTRFAAALVSHKLLDAKNTELLTTGKVETPRGGDKYAYGFFDHKVGGLRCFGHGGGAPGMNGELEICPESGYVIVALANVDPHAAEHMVEFVGSRLPAK